jgi:hypothetical protein
MIVFYNYTHVHYNPLCWSEWGISHYIGRYITLIAFLPVVSPFVFWFATTTLSRTKKIIYLIIPLVFYFVCYWLQEIVRSPRPNIECVARDLFITEWGVPLPDFIYVTNTIFIEMIFSLRDHGIYNLWSPNPPICWLFVFAVYSIAFYVSYLGTIKQMFISTCISLDFVFVLYFSMLFIEQQLRKRKTLNKI